MKENVGLIEFSENNEDVKDPKKFVFIIDEINRGEISKIFGELFFSIDPGYRGQAGMVLTQYSNMHADLSEKFYVPENVYIIGTMNDIDRSVDTFDFAMRRRFAFIPIMAKDSQDMITDDDLKCRMNNLNEAILSIDGLNENYQIGAAYFKQVQDGKLTIEELWDYYLDSLLRDYMQGMDDVNEQIEKLKGEYGYNKEKLEDSEPDVQTNSESDN